MSDFEDIRPYRDDEVTEVLKGLLVNDDFLEFIGKYHSPRMSRLLPAGVRFAARKILSRRLANVASIQTFQELLSSYVKKIVSETMIDFSFSGLDKLPEHKPCLFVGNHRDIAGDSMLVNYALWLSGRSTVRIAVGDNLVQRDFATALMRLNKSFFIKRSEAGAKKVYAALLTSSKYIQHSLNEGESVWIAQSEGRAKDGMDVTDPALVKMLGLASRKQPLNEVVGRLNIVPVSVSYEYDPCDMLKAQSLEAEERQGSYDKPQGEDLLSLVKGLGEFKGRVRLNFGEPIAGAIHTAEDVAKLIDRQILDNYQLFPVGYWALQRLANKPGSARVYADTWHALKGSVSLNATDFFEARLHACPMAWQSKWLEMYANPVVQKYAAKADNLRPL